MVLDEEFGAGGHHTKHQGMFTHWLWIYFSPNQSGKPTDTNLFLLTLLHVYSRQWLDWHGSQLFSETLTEVSGKLFVLLFPVEQKKEEEEKKKEA